MQLDGKVCEALDRDGAHDRVLAVEMAVQHRLAVLHELGQPARGHRFPPLGLGEAARL
jgi:hypothetical protein